MRILAVSGSLRAGSSNTRVIEALARLAPPGVEVVVHPGIGALPHFNPDLDGEGPPPEVLEWRRQIGLCDGLVLCSPEYAHGVAGVMKNALDWLVPSLEFPETPVALINASPRAERGQAHLRETLTVMTARIVEPACVAVPLLGRNLDAAAIAADPELSAQLAGALSAFVSAIGTLKAATA
jgi:chromate reductase, NAD(P)H dehydrogenase (quinone)